MLGFIVYLMFCFIFAAAGSGKSIGYWGAFFCCVFITPVIGLIIAIASSREYVIVCKHCQHKTKQDTPTPPEFCPKCDKNQIGLTSAQMREAVLRNLNPQQA